MIQRLKRILKRKTSRRSKRSNYTAESLEVRTLLAAVTEIDVDFAEPFNPVEFDGRIYFAGNATGGGYQLLAADQTGVEVIHDLGQLDPGYLENLVHVVDDSLIFVAHTNDLGTELYRSNGTSAGTELLADINPAVGESGVTAEQWTTAVTMTQTGWLFFAADDGTHGVEPWRSDGTSAGTFLLNDVRSGPEGSNPNSAVGTVGRYYEDGEYYSYTYFLADDGLHGEELWRSNGTVDATGIIGNFSTGAASSQITHITPDGRTHSGGGTGVAFYVGWDSSVWHVTGAQTGSTFFQYDYQRISRNREVVDLDRSVNPLGRSVSFRMSFADSSDVYLHRNDHSQDAYGAVIQNDSGIPAKFYDGDLVLTANIATDAGGNETTEYSFVGIDTTQGFGDARLGPVLLGDDDEFGVVGPIELDYDHYILAIEQADGTLNVSEFEPGWIGAYATHTGFQTVSLENAAVFDDRVWFVADGDVYSRYSTLIQETKSGGVEDMAVTEYGIYAAAPSQDKLLFIDGQLDAPTWLTPQTAIDGNAEWATVDHVTEYEFAETDRPTPPADTYWNSHLTSTTETTIQPTGWGQRYLHVRAVSGSIRSEWSTIVVFNTAIPNLVSPGPDHLVGQDDSYYEHLQGFELQVGHPLAEIEIYRVGESEPVVTKNTWDGIAEPNGTVRSPELPIGEYQWRARSFSERFGQTVNSAWSDLQSFRIATDGVTLLLPGDNSFSGYSDPAFRWTRYLGFDHSDTESATDSYKLQIYNLSTETTELLVDVDGTQHYAQLPVGRYRAWVLPFDQGQRTQWSRPIDFTVGIDTYMFTDSDNNDALTLRVRGASDDITYELWVNQQGGESGIIHETDISPDYVLPDTLPDGRYRAYVRATYESGEQTEWTDAIHFTKGEYDFPVISFVPTEQHHTWAVFWKGPESATSWRLFFRNKTTGVDKIISESELPRRWDYTADSYQPAEYYSAAPLGAGDYTVWVRGYHDGVAVTKWSVGESYTIVRNEPPEFYWASYPKLLSRSHRIEIDFFDYRETIVGYEINLLHLQSGYSVTESKMTDSIGDLDYQIPDQISVGTYEFYYRFVFDDGTFSDKSYIRFSII